MARRRKTLSEEDQKLWEMVTQSAEPLHAVSYVLPAPIVAAKRPEVKNPRPIKPFKMNGRPESRLRFDLATDPMQPLSRAPQALDKRTHDRLRKGKKAPEARIDLHGMTAAQAHGALRGFILSCHARGLRLVLVITGKGKDRDEDGPIPVRRGVLRHNVPGWLSAAPLGPVVLQVSSAHLKHGGHGAYYVYLRRQR